MSRKSKLGPGLLARTVVYRCQCQRSGCGHVWTSREGIPAHCAKCSSPTWRTPEGGRWICHEDGCGKTWTSHRGVTPTVCANRDCRSSDISPFNPEIHETETEIVSA